MHNVSTTDVLTDREVRSIMTLLAGAKPNVPVTFPSEPRGGISTFEEIQFTISELRKISIQLPKGVTCGIAVENLNAGETFEISEVHFCNPADFPYDVVHVNDNYANKIEKIPQRVIFKACSVYKAVFNTPIPIPSHPDSAKVSLKTSTYSGTAPSVYLTSSPGREQSIRLNEGTLKIKLGLDRNYSYAKSVAMDHLFASVQDPKSWCFLVGIKGRMVKRAVNKAK